MTIESERSPKLIRPSPGPRPPTTIIASTPTGALGGTPEVPQQGPSPLQASTTSADDAVLVQRHACLHIHGVYPYFYVPQYDENVTATQFGAQLETVALRELFARAGDDGGHSPLQRPDAQSTTSAAATRSAGEEVSLSDPFVAPSHASRLSGLPQAPSHRQLLHNVELVSRVPFYGYHRQHHAFFKISVIDPSHVLALVELLRDSTRVGQRAWQPYESHHSFHSQFMMDYGVSGLAPLRLHRCNLRCPLPVEFASLVPPDALRGCDGRDWHAEAAVRARRQALDVTSVALPDERERLTAAEVELDVRGADLRLADADACHGSEAGQKTARDDAEEERSRAGTAGAAALVRTVTRAGRIGAHLAHTRRSLKQYFLHHGVPDQLRVAQTMEEEDRVQEAMRRGLAIPTDAHASELRYGTVEQLQRNDPAACAMRERLRENLTSTDEPAHETQTKREEKPEKVSFWLLKQQRGAQTPPQKAPWLANPAASHNHNRSRFREPSAPPWAELDPLGPPCHDEAGDHLDPTDHSTAPEPLRTAEDIVARRFSSDANVPQTFELLEALGRPLPTDVACETDGTATAAATVGSRPTAKDTRSSIADMTCVNTGEHRTKDGDDIKAEDHNTHAEEGEEDEALLWPSSSSQETNDSRTLRTADHTRAHDVPPRPPSSLPLRFQAGDTVAFVLRITRQRRTCESREQPHTACAAQSAASVCRTCAASKVVYRVLAAGQLDTVSAHTQTASIQWCVSLLETHLDTERRRLIREGLWQPPETVVRVVQTGQQESARDEEVVCRENKCLVLGAGEWMQAEGAVSKDIIPLSILRNPLPIRSLEDTLAADGDKHARVELLTCSLRLFPTHARYQRAIEPPLASVLSAKGRTESTDTALTWPLIVAAVCRYTYSFRSRLLHPLDARQCAALHMSTTTCFHRPGRWIHHNEEGASVEEVPGVWSGASGHPPDAYEVPLAHTQRGSFLLFPEQDVTAPPPKARTRSALAATTTDAATVLSASDSPLYASPTTSESDLSPTSSSSSSWPSPTGLFSQPLRSHLSASTDATRTTQMTADEPKEEEEEESEAQPLVVTPFPSSPSSAFFAETPCHCCHMTHSHKHRDTYPANAVCRDCCACQPVRTAEELTHLLSHLPFTRAIAREREAGDVALTQGRLLHRFSSDTLAGRNSAEEAMPREHAQSTPPAPWRAQKRARAMQDRDVADSAAHDIEAASHSKEEAAPRTASCTSPSPTRSPPRRRPRGSVHFVFTPDPGTDEIPLLPFDDSPAFRPERVLTAQEKPPQSPSLSRPPPMVHQVTSAMPLTSSMHSGTRLRMDLCDQEEVDLEATRDDTKAGIERKAGYPVDDDDDDVQEVSVTVAHDRSHVTHAQHRSRSAEEVILSHSESPLSLETMIPAHSADALIKARVTWRNVLPSAVEPVASAGPPALAVLQSTARCALSEKANDALAPTPSFFLTRSSSAPGALTRHITAATWPITSSEASPSAGPTASTAGSASAPTKTAPTRSPVRPPPPPPPSSASPPSALRRSETTLSSHHFLTCHLRIQHVEVMLNRREGAQHVVGDPLLAVALGQSSTGRDTIAVRLFCVRPQATSSSAPVSFSPPPPPPAAHKDTRTHAASAADKVGAPTAHFSSSPLPSHASCSFLQGHTWCLTDHVDVVELPSERAVLLRVQHEMACYDPDIVVSWEGFKYGLGLLSLRYRAVLGRSLSRDLSRLRPVRSLVEELARQSTRHVKGNTAGAGVALNHSLGDLAVDTDAHQALPRRPFHITLPARTAVHSQDAAPISSTAVLDANGEGHNAVEAAWRDEDVDADAETDELAAAIAAYNLDLDEEATDVQTAIAKRYAKRFGATVRIVGRVVSSISKDIRKTVKLGSHTLPHVHAALTGEHLPYFSDTTLAHLYNIDSGAGQTRGGHYALALRYVLTTVVGVHRVTSALHYHTQAMEFSRLYGVLYEEAITRGSQFKVEATLCRIARPQGYLMLSPSMGATHRQPRIQRIPLIMQPRSDFYKDPVIVLDFRSLYPSIVIAYNLCYSTCAGLVQPRTCGRLGVLPRYRQDTELLRGLLLAPTDAHANARTVVDAVKPKVEVDDVMPTRAFTSGDGGELHAGEDVAEAGRTPPSSTPLGVYVAPNGAIFVPPFVRPGVLPQMLSAVLDTRFEVQAADKHVAQPSHDAVMHTRLQEQQLALKMLANTTYGYTAASYTGRMPCVDLAEAIVALGRQTLERAIALVHERTDWRAEVVYGDTDSLFVHLPGRTREEAFAIGGAIAAAVTASNPSPVTLQFEKVLQPCLLLVKKRYTGYAWFKRDQTKPTFLAKGIETVRRDQCPMTSRLTEMFLRALFDGATPHQLHQLYRREASQLQSGAANVSEFIFRRAVKLGRYQDERHLPLAARLALTRMQRDLLQTPLWGERLPYVVCRSLVSTQLRDQVVSPQEMIAVSSRLTIHTEYYMRNHLNAALDRIFFLVGISFTRWYGELARRGQWSSYLDVDAFLHLQTLRRTRRQEEPGREGTRTTRPPASAFHHPESRLKCGRPGRDKDDTAIAPTGLSPSFVSLRSSSTTSGHSQSQDSDLYSTAHNARDHRHYATDAEVDEDGADRDRPVDVERVVGATQKAPSPITVDELSPLDGTAHDVTVIEVDEEEGETTASEEERDQRVGETSPNATSPPLRTGARPPSPSAPLMATQRVNGMRTLDRYYPRARCVVCEQQSVTLEAHQQQLRAALHHHPRRAHRHRRRLDEKGEVIDAVSSVSLRAVPPICATCWSDPLTLFSRVQTRYAAVARRLHTIEEACQVCLGSVGQLGGPTYLRALGDLEELPLSLFANGAATRPASTAVPRHLTHPVAFLTVADAARAMRAAHARTGRAVTSANSDSTNLIESTLGCTSIDCSLAFDKRRLLLERTQLQALSWHLTDIL